MSPSPRDPASEPPVEGVAVPKTGLKNALPRDNLYPIGAPASRVRRSTRLSESPAVCFGQGINDDLHKDMKISSLQRFHHSECPARHGFHGRRRREEMILLQYENEILGI